MKVTLPVIYSQLDEPWAHDKLGYNSGESETIYNFGCLIVSLSNAINRYGVPINPLDLNTKLRDVAGFVPATGLYVHGALKRLYPQLEEKWVETPQKLTDGQMKEIFNAIDQGCPVIICIDVLPETSIRNDHYVIACDYDPADENNITIADPLGGKVHSLKDYLRLAKPTARDTIEAYVIVSQGPFIMKDVAVPAAPVVEPVKPEPLPVPVAPQITPEKPMSTTNSSPLPDNYGDIVKQSTEYEKVVEYLEIPRLPKDTMFEDIRRVIGGFKSRATDLQNKLNDALIDKAKTDITIKTQLTKISDLQTELLTKEKTHLAEVEALKKVNPSVENLKAQYDASYTELNNKYKKLLEDKHTAEITAAEERIREVAQVASQVGTDVTAILSRPANTPVEVQKKRFDLISAIARPIINLFTLKW